MFSNRFTRRYDIELPIAQAGMGFVAGPALAVAVCNAGGFGSLGLGLLPPAAFGAAVAEIRAGTTRPFNVNFLVPFTTDEGIAIIRELAPATVSFHWGHPKRAWIDGLKAAGIGVWEQVGSVDAAKRAVDDGVELVIAQGSEAGGHNYGSMSTLALTPAVVDAVSGALVLAAGGIADGRGLAAALALGADGAWVGTRMVATLEADAMAAYKEALVAASGTDTVLSSVFGPQWPDFNPMRVIRNQLVNDYQARRDEIPATTADLPVIARLPFGGQVLDMHRFDAFVPAAGTTGDLQQMPLLAGEAVGLIRSIEPAAQVLARMMEEARAVLSRLDACSRGA
jgi:NAD(P)H-dependent flavin oxidoreductase YrpB (nitropropane dioxygenase family)